MAYTVINASQTDADSPLDQTLMDAIRTDLDDLNTRVSAIQASSQASIFDDFTGRVFDPDVWDAVAAGGGGTIPSVQFPNHYNRLLVASSATDYSGINATTKRMRFRLDFDHTISFEARLKHSNATSAELFFGFQDAETGGGDGFAQTRANNIDYTDMIGFVRGTNANTLKFITAKGGSTDSSDNLGTFYPSFATMKIVITYAGATKQVQAYTGTTRSDYTECSGSPFTTTSKHPAVALKPWLGLSNNSGGTAEVDIDWAVYQWITQPLNS